MHNPNEYTFTHFNKKKSGMGSSLNICRCRLLTLKIPSFSRNPQKYVVQYTRVFALTQTFETRQTWTFHCSIYIFIDYWQKYQVPLVQMCVSVNSLET